jgi:hypothetical protein
MMRSFALAALLVACLASVTEAQATSRITGPINKARSAAAAASARTEAQQRDAVANQQRDSSQAGRDSATAGPVSTERAPQANSGMQAAPKPDAKTPTTAQAGKTVASAATGKAPPTTAAGKAPATAPASGKATPPGPSPSSGPVVAAPTNRGRASGASPEPAAKAGTVASKTSGAAGNPGAASPNVTPPATRPSTTVESAPDTGRRASFGPQAPKPDVSISREVYGYEPSGRRDPFVSLLQTDELRPFLTDLLFVGVIWDARGRSVALMRDVKTKEQYRARVGHLVGRMRVTSIDKKQVVFTIEEFGFSRQETLIAGDTSKVRK